MTSYREIRNIANNSYQEILVYIIENDLLTDMNSDTTDIIECFHIDVPELIKELQQSAGQGIETDDIIEHLEIYFDINEEETDED